MQSTRKWKKIKQLILNVLCTQSQNTADRMSASPVNQSASHSTSAAPAFPMTSIVAPFSEHATNRKTVQRRPVRLMPQRNPMRCRPDSCTWLRALARKPRHLHAAAVLLSAAWTCSAGTAACHSQCMLYLLRIPAWLPDTWSASMQEMKNLACAIHYSISFVNHFYTRFSKFLQQLFLYLYSISIWYLFSFSMSFTNCNHFSMSLSLSYWNITAFQCGISSQLWQMPK